MRTSVYTRMRQSSYEDSKAIYVFYCKRRGAGAEGRGGGGQLCLGKSVRHGGGGGGGGAILPRGGHSFLGTNVRGTIVPTNECPRGHFFQGDSHASDTGSKLVWSRAAITCCT